MADQLDITVSVKRNGQDVPGFPYRHRVLVDEVQTFSYEKADGGGYVSLPIAEVASVSALILTADQALTVRLDGQSDAGIPLTANGLLLVIGGPIDAGASTNATIDNSSGSTAVVKGLGAGT